MWDTVCRQWQDKIIISYFKTAVNDDQWLCSVYSTVKVTIHNQMHSLVSIMERIHPKKEYSSLLNKFGKGF